MATVRKKRMSWHEWLDIAGALSEVLCEWFIAWLVKLSSRPAARRVKHLMALRIILSTEIVRLVGYLIPVIFGVIAGVGGAVIYSWPPEIPLSLGIICAEGLTYAKAFRTKRVEHINTQYDEEYESIPFWAEIFYTPGIWALHRIAWGTGAVYLIIV